MNIFGDKNLTAQQRQTKNAKKAKARKARARKIANQKRRAKRGWLW